MAYGEGRGRIPLIVEEAGAQVPGGSSCCHGCAVVACQGKGGKAVICYGESFTSGSYYIASVADKIYTTAHHGGNNFFLGISGRMLFLKDLLDKLGVNYQLIRHGKYKSAGETYIKNTPSPENMEQNQAMIDSMWETVAEETAQSRGISVDSLNYFIENLSIGLPEDMLSHGLADEALSAEGLEDKLALLLVVDRKAGDIRGQQIGGELDPLEVAL